MKTRRIAGIGIVSLLSLGSCASPELYLPINKETDKRVFVAGIDGFADVVLENDLHKLGHDIYRECNATVVVNSVDLEEKNMEKIREAHEQGERIALVGYSMGSKRTYSLVKLCEKERIKIDLVIFYDPTFTETEPMYKPKNVDRCVAYFSLGPFAGNKKNLRGEIEIRDSPRNHFELVNWNDLKKDWTSDIEKIRKEK